MKDLRNDNAKMRIYGLVTVLATLACVTTLVIRIPIPATTGYFNIGDVFVLLAALWLGPKYGLIVGALGPTLADAIGYPQFILATAVTKGLEGLVAGIAARRMKKHRMVAAAIGAAIMVTGYFLFEAFVYPAIGKVIPFFAVTNVGAALIEIPVNALQGLIGSVVAFGLWKTLSGDSNSQE